MDVCFGLGRERRNARYESAAESEVGMSAWQLDRRLEKSINISLSWLGTDQYIRVIKVGFLNSINGFGICAFKDIDAAGIGLITGDGVTSDNMLGQWVQVVAHVAVVALVIADENARL